MLYRFAASCSRSIPARGRNPQKRGKGPFKQDDRACVRVTDSTIKVHMKSILRKIRVANRTQAAVWALERGYGADANRRPPAFHLQHELAAA